MIWQHLGFKENIFFIKPLMPTKEDIELFAGRTNDISKFVFDVFNEKRALKIVSGELGVGKTTFVNACQYYSYIQQVPFQHPFPIPKILPCFEKIQIRETDTLDDITQKSIVALSRSIVIHCEKHNISSPKEAKDILSYFLDLSIKSGGGSLGGGVSILGTGANFSKSSSSASVNVLRNARFYLKKLVDIVKVTLKLHGCFILINNLDILSNKKLITFVDEARDELFDIDGLYWILIGRKGIGSVIASESDRVTDYLSGTESYLAPLDFSTIKQIIKLRSEKYSNTNSIQIPLSDKVISAVHYLSMQETRETFKICGEIVKRVISFNPSFKQVPDGIAIDTLFNYSYDCTKDLDLNPPQLAVLKAVYKSEDNSCRPKDFGRFGYKSSQGFIGALKGLVRKRLLTVEERGRARIYKLTGMTAMAAITGALGEEIRKASRENLSERLQKGNLRSEGFFQDAQLNLELDDETY